jgi:hypothetical protein
MERDDAQRTLGDIERMRLGTRRLLNPLWFFNIVFGLFFAGTALIVVADAPGPVAAVYWGVGGLLAVFLVVRITLQIERELGLDSRVWDVVTGITCALVISVVLANLLIDAALAPLVPAVLALLAYGYVLRDPFELAAGGGLAIALAAVALVDPSSPGVWGNGALGVSLLAAGVAGRLGGAPRRDAVVASAG